MYKYLISLTIFLISFSSFASAKIWKDLNSGGFYVLSQQLELSDQQSSFSIKPNTKLFLKERSSLSMIKVELYKFDVSGLCPSHDMTTDVQLIEISQSNGKTVTAGFDLAQDCVLEIFIELTDLETESIFN